MAESLRPQNSLKQDNDLFAPPTKSELSLADNELFAPPSDHELAQSKIVSTGEVSGELPFGTRARLGFASGNEERRGLLQKLYPGIEFARMVKGGDSHKDAVEVVKLPGSDGYTYIDSPSLSLADAADFIGDIPSVVTGVGAGLMAAPTGPGAIAASGAGAAGGEMLRKYIGRKFLDIPDRQSFMQDVGDVAISGGVGAAVPAAGMLVKKGYDAIKSGAAKEGAKKAIGILQSEVGAIGDIPESSVKQAATSIPEKAIPSGDELARRGLIKDPGIRAKEVEIAGEKLGIPTTRGMKSEDPIIRGLESSLEQSPTAFGSLVRRRTKEVTSGLEDVVNKMTATRTNETADQIGDGLKQALTEKISSRYEPIQGAYSSIRESTKNIPVSEKSIKSVSKNIREFINNDLVPGTPEADFVESVAKKLESIKSADQVKSIKSIVGDRLRNGPREQRYALIPLVEKLERLEKNTIMREAIKQARTGEEGANIGKGLISSIKGANKDYRELITLLQDVGGKTKISKSRTVSEFLEDLDDVPSMQLADKLFKSKDTKTLGIIKKEFPEEFDLIRKHKIREIYESSLAGDRVDARKFLKAIDSYEPEVQQLLFGKVFDAKNIPYEEAFSSLRTLVNSWPEKIGPSGTPKGLDYQSLLDPMMYARDAGRYAMYRGRRITPASPGLIRAQQATGRGLLTPQLSGAAVRATEE